MDSSKKISYGFSPKELRKIHSLDQPRKIQKFLELLPYHLADTAWSPRRVLKERKAHCLEGAIFAAAALRLNGYPPLIVDLESVQDTDHILAVFQDEEGNWGAIAKSNFAGLEFRESVYKSVRELVMSYFDDYYNLRGERTLRKYSRPINLARFDSQNWMTTEEPIWFIAKYLTKVKHHPLLSRAKKLNRVSTRAFKAGLVGHAWK